MRKVEKRLRERIKELEKELCEVKEDREKFRKHFARRFRWFLELLGKNQTANMNWLVESDAKELALFQSWYW